MKTFHFPLQRVLDVKRIREDIHKRELAMAIRAEEREWDLLYAVQKKEKELRERLRGKAYQVVNPVEMVMYHRYAQKLKDDIVQQYDKIDEAKKVVKTKRDKLVQASKEKEALEKLKEKKLSEYRKGVEKEDRAFLDEIASTQPRRKRGGTMSES